MTPKDEYTRQWIIENSIPIIQKYRGMLTLRALHYRLVALGMHNTLRHYRRVVAAMTKARWDGQAAFDDFVDHEREMLGETRAEPTDVDEQIATAKGAIRLWMTAYRKNRWENQPVYPEVFIEKKALIGVFEPVCAEWDIALCPCKGYPSLTYMHDAACRFREAAMRDRKPIIFYLGDYDPSGEDIPRTIQDTLFYMGIEIEIIRVALLEHQVAAWKLPPAPTKDTDTRSAAWDGIGQVELDAVELLQLQDLLRDAIEVFFSESLYEDLVEQEQQEAVLYRDALKSFVREL